MSAFICNDRTINRILSFLHRQTDCFVKDFIEREFNKLGFSVIDEDKLQEFGEAIRELNFKSIGQRYGKTTEKNDRKLFEPYKFKFEDCSIEQAYQHLACLTYQCCEGNCERKKLYKALDKLETYLAHTIARREADKLNCKWEAD